MHQLEPRLHVEALNLRDRLALLSDGTWCRVTDMFDADLEPTDDPLRAAAVVAGRGRTWFDLRVSDFQPVPSH